VNSGLVALMEGHMATSDEEELKQLLTAPRESLDVELKQWIDPKFSEGIAEIAKGCIALRNNNGGRLVEVCTGQEMDAGTDHIRVLDFATWDARRRRLAELGGPILPPDEG
jgi:hypothetical protein